MKRLSPWMILVSAILSITALRAADQPKFEVASVKRTNACEVKTSLDSALVTLDGVPLKLIVGQAFKVRADQIEGPSWLDTDCYAISAKLPQSATKDQVPAMLQALLAERLKLATHVDQRPHSGFALIVDPAGLKCKEDDPKTNFMGNLAQGSRTFGSRGNGRLKGAMTMAALADYLSKRGYAPVQDLTGLTAKYDIDLSWTPDPAFELKGPDAADSAAAPEPSLFAALRELLGLRMESRKVSVDYVVIDHIERVPSEN